MLADCSADGHSPVVHRTQHRSLSGECHISRPLGLEQLTVEVVCLLAAPDSPMAHWIVRCDLSSQTVFLLLTLQTMRAVPQMTKPQQLAMENIDYGGKAYRIRNSSYADNHI